MKSQALPKTSDPVSLMQDKTVLRRALGAARAELSPHEATTAAERATALLLADPAWIAARHVALYMAMPHELSTVSLIKEAWAEGKGVWLPRCLPKCLPKSLPQRPSPVPGAKEPGRMLFARCDSLDDLSPGAFGIQEPRAHCPVHGAGTPLPDLLILPAVGLDATGTRLGYGGGYYDNLLRDPLWAAVPRVGAVFACQLVPHLPREPWDQPVHALLSEEGLTWL